jgi:disulfide bond formation protein DsbB
MTIFKNILQNRILSITSMCLLTIVSAYIVEIFAKVPPCKLCIYQRIPYLIIIFVGIVSLIFKKELIFLYLSLLTFFINFFISFFHSLVERKLIRYDAGCSSSNENFEDIESLRMSLENTPIAKCDEINFSIFGLSLANINLIILIFFIFINILFIVKK